MVSSKSYWRLVPATTFQIWQWSYGLVRTTSDLYDPAIFGPKEDLRCACGKYSGEEAVGRVCYECGVIVAANAASARRERLGHLGLACPAQHPLDENDILEAFPVAPIAYRIGSDMSPNELGKKYESLVEANEEAAEALPEKGSEEYYSRAVRFDTTRLVETMRDIIGIPEDPSGRVVDIDSKGSLVPLALDALLRNKADLFTLLRCCPYVLEVKTIV